VPEISLMPIPLKVPSRQATTRIVTCLC
jgi:hypothetical protein